MDALRNAEYLCCLAANAGVAVSVDAVQEVFESRQITRLPGCPPWVAGMANLRGSVVPVLNPWGLPAPGGAIKKIVVLKTAEGPVGLLITRLIDLMRFEKFGECGAPPRPLDGSGDVFDAMAESAEGVGFLLLNVEQMIAGTL